MTQDWMPKRSLGGSRREKENERTNDDHHGLGFGLIDERDYVLSCISQQTEGIHGAIKLREIG